MEMKAESSTSEKSQIWSLSTQNLDLACWLKKIQKSIIEANFD